MSKVTRFSSKKRRDNRKKHFQIKNTQIRLQRKREAEKDLDRRVVILNKKEGIPEPPRNFARKIQETVQQPSEDKEEFLAQKERFIKEQILWREDANYFLRLLDECDALIHYKSQQIDSLEIFFRKKAKEFAKQQSAIAVQQKLLKDSIAEAGKLVKELKALKTTS